jgi:hypothetical protein
MKARTALRAAALAVLSLLVMVTAVGRLSGSDAVATGPTKDFTLTTQPLSASVQRGQTATFALAVAPVWGFTGKVTLSASGLTTGMSASFTPASLALDGTTAGSTLTVATTSSTPTGSATITVTGTSGSTRRTLSLVVVVAAPPPAGLAVAITPATISVAPGSTASYAVAVSRLNGYTGPIVLTTAGTLPGGISTRLSPTSLPAGTSSPAPATLTVTTTPSTPVATTALTVTAAAAPGIPATSSSATATLVVDANQSSKPFALAGDALGAMSPGLAPSPVDLVVTNPNNQALRITNLGVTVTGTSRPACGAAEFTVRQYAGSYPLAVAARAQGVRLTTLGVPHGALPAISMLDRPGNQDACKGVTVHLAYTGTATNQ